MLRTDEGSFYNNHDSMPFLPIVTIFMSDEEVVGEWILWSIAELHEEPRLAKPMELSGRPHRPMMAGYAFPRALSSYGVAVDAAIFSTFPDS